MKTQDLSEFASGMEYDAQYDKHYEDDIALIQKHITAMGARSLLDVCCGTGIVTIPVAKKLDNVVGIDIAEGMLKQAKRKAQGLDNLSFLQQDATQFSLDKRFDMAIMTGNAFQASHSDLQGLRRMILVTRDAHGLYEQYGFKPIESAENFMQIWNPNVYQGDNQ